MSYQQIDDLVQRQVINFNVLERRARLAAKNFVNKLEGSLSTQGVPLAARTLVVMKHDGGDWSDARTWDDVESVNDLMSFDKGILTFAVALRFFDPPREVARIILPVSLTARGTGDDDFMFGCSLETESSASGGSYAQPAADAVARIGSAAASWKYERHGVETIIVN